MGRVRRHRQSLRVPRVPRRAGGIGQRRRAIRLAACADRVDGADGAPVAIAPAYAKSHSQGEYVFDHAWADAWERAGGAYYPKLQVAAPFSPVPGPRLLLRDPAAAPALIGALEAVTEQNGLSSAHATFVAPDQVAAFEAAGWLIREGTQFHWANQGYASFDDFLGNSPAASARRSARSARRRSRASPSAT